MHSDERRHCHATSCSPAMSLDALDLPAFLLYDPPVPAADSCYLSALLGAFASPAAHCSPATGLQKKRRRRRPRSCKNKEEAESQRMTHIAVERNRRRQMNDHLAVLRSLMPDSYVQRGDQASIVGGAIEYVKELEQLLQALEAQKMALEEGEPGGWPPFAQFFSYPQYLWCLPGDARGGARGVADVEVTLVETHASMRILSARRPGQLAKMVVGLQALHLTVLHLNITSLDPMVLYTVNAKVEEGCSLGTADDIAAAVHHMLTLIEAEVVAATGERWTSTAMHHRPGMYH